MAETDISHIYEMCEGSQDAGRSRRFKEFVGEESGRVFPEGVSEILSGGARGVDTSAKEYAETQGIPLREFLPEYERYGRAAPLRRNLALLAEADLVPAFCPAARHL